MYVDQLDKKSVERCCDTLRRAAYWPMLHLFIACNLPENGNGAICEKT